MIAFLRKDLCIRVTFNWERRRFAPIGVGPQRQLEKMIATQTDRRPVPVGERFQASVAPAGLTGNWSGACRQRSYMSLGVDGP